jgi:hypothetical protein
MGVPECGVFGADHLGSAHGKRSGGRIHALLSASNEVHEFKVNSLDAIVLDRVYPSCVSLN